MQMQLHFRMQRAFAQTRQRTVLGLAKQCRFCARQNQREARSQIRPCDQPDRRLHEVWQWRIALLKEGLRIELDLARRRGETASRPRCVWLGIFGVVGLQRHPDAAGGGAQALQADAGRAELVAVGGIDVADCASVLISKPIFSPSRSKAEATGSTTSANSAVGFMKRSAWA